MAEAARRAGGRGSSISSPGGAHRGGAALGRLGPRDQPRASGGALQRPGAPGRRSTGSSRRRPARPLEGRLPAANARSPRRSISTATRGCSGRSTTSSTCSSASTSRSRSGRGCGRAARACAGASTCRRPSRSTTAGSCSTGRARRRSGSSSLARGLCRGRVQGRPDHAARAALVDRPAVRGAAAALQLSALRAGRALVLAEGGAGDPAHQPLPPDALRAVAPALRLGGGADANGGRVMDPAPKARP